MAKLSNASNYLSGVNGPCPDALGEQVALHATVIDFLSEHGLSRWPQSGDHADGYRYFMAFSTLPQCGWSNNCPEKPYLVVSDDNSTWGNPHDDVEPEDLSPFFGGCSPNQNQSDPDLIYDPYNDEIYLCMNNENGTGHQFRRISNDWSYTPPNAATQCNYLWSFYSISQSVVIEDQGTWHLYCIVHHEAGVVRAAHPTDPYNTPQIHHLRSEDEGETWADQGICTEDVIPDNYPGYWPHHIKAKKNAQMSNVIELVVSCTLSTTPGETAPLSPIQLAHLRTTFENPKNLTVPSYAPTLLLEPNTGSQWDSDALYRSDFTTYATGAEMGMNLWYSGTNQANPLEDSDFGIGFTNGVLGIYLPIVESDRAPGEYDAGTLITLSAITNSTATSIEYAWSDSEPTSWGTYSTPLSIRIGTLWFRGVDADGLKSAWESVAYVYRGTTSNTSGEEVTSNHLNTGAPVTWTPLT